MIFGKFWRGFRTTFSFFFNRDLVKFNTPLTRQLDFQGSGGSGNTTFLLFFRVWFPDGFGNGFLMIFRWIWGPFWLPKSIKNVIDFRIDFRNAEKVDY